NQVGGVEDQRSILVGALGIIDGERSVIQRVHQDVDGGGRGAAVSIGQRVGEAGRAVEVGGGGVGDGAVGVEDDAAMGGCGVLHCTDHQRLQRGSRIGVERRIVVHIAVVGNQVAGVEDQGHVFVGALGVIDGDRIVVDRVHQDVDGGAESGGAHV